MLPYQIVRSKMEKTKVLLTDRELALYIPETVFYSPENLEKMLTSYALVYVKPDRGRGGKRVISIVKNQAGFCRLHYKTEIMNYQTVKEAASYITSVSAGDSFIIQQGIHLLCINSVPFDLRVNVQKPYNNWEVTAMIAKVAAAGKAVTNYSQGATLAHVETALLRAGLDPEKAKMTIAVLTRLGHRTASVLNRKYWGLRELGLDIGIDRDARPWILEVNTHPQFIQGHKLFDHYRKIIRQNTRRKNPPGRERAFPVRIPETPPR
ncbi:MAG: YheC/YheD family protein [Bacillota bacterium]